MRATILVLVGNDDVRASDRASSGGNPLRVWMRYGESDIELPEGETIIGRSPGSGIVLDDPLVSRAHARVTVQGGLVTLEDLGSANGVLVNGEGLSRARMLASGDRVNIGQQSLQLFIEVASSQRAERLAARTLTGATTSPPEFATTEAPREKSERSEKSELTRKSDALDLLVGVVEKVLALGRGEEAERLLGNYLRNLLQEARVRGVEVATAEKAVMYAVRIAEATSKGAWVDYTFELYSALKRPLPAGIVDRLYGSIRRLSPVSVGVFRQYLAVLRAAEAEMGPADRFLLRRIEGLESQGALK